jgi:hypothetical protein
MLQRVSIDRNGRTHPSLNEIEGEIISFYNCSPNLTLKTLRNALFVKTEQTNTGIKTFG